MKKSSKAFSIMELIIVVIFIGILSAIAIPRINFAIIRKSKANTTSELIVAGLRKTRRLAISNAAEDSDGNRLVMQGGSPYSGFIITNGLGNQVLETFTFDADVAVTNDNLFRFGPLGNLLDANSQIDVAAEGRSFTITVVPATGMIKCVRN